MFSQAYQSKKAWINQNRTQMRRKVRQNLSLNLSSKNKINQVYRIMSPILNSQQNQFFNPEQKINSSNEISNTFESQYEVLEKIGEGAHSTVNKCRSKASGKVYAVKVIKHRDDESLQLSKNQFQIYRNLSHPFITHFEKLYVDQAHLTTYVVQQYCPFKTLKQQLHSRRNTVFQEEEVLKILKSLLQALLYIHNRGLCHRDIKLQNVLYNPGDCQIKIIDFDCSKNKKKDEKEFELWTKTGTLYYQAPQYFLKGFYSQKVDIWAAGIIAYELLTGNVPFKSNYYHKVVKMITEQQINMQKVVASANFKNLLVKLLEKDDTQRFSAKKSLLFFSLGLN